MRRLYTPRSPCEYDVNWERPESRLPICYQTFLGPFITSLIMASAQIGRTTTLKPAIQSKPTAASHPVSPVLRSRTFRSSTANPVRRSNMVVTATNGTAVQSPPKIEVIKKDTIEVLKASARLIQ